MSHSIIPPSSAGIWGKPDGCPGWVMMSAMYPETESSPEAMDGEASHELGALMIDSARRANHDYPKREKLIGTAATNGVIFTDEMFEAAELYANNVAEVIRDTGVFGGPNLGIEHRVECPAIHAESFGTTDCFLYDKNGGHLYVWDYKFGFEQVEAFENWQGINYLAGLLDQLGIDGHADQYLTVHIRIVQPRAFHRDGPVREWRINAASLRGYFNILSTNAHKALSGNAECHTGSHCKHCQARHACPAALTAGMRLFEVSSAPVPVELSPQALGVQLAIVKRARKALEYLESGYEEQVKSLIKSGKGIPGWLAVPGYGRKKWAKPVAEVIAMGEILGQDLRKKPEAITPNQAQKLGIDEAVINAYSETPRNGINVVEDNGNQAKQVFNNE